MLETLQKMSGTTHRTYRDSKTVTHDTKALLKMNANEGKISYTMTTKEEPVIGYNDMAYISERNSIVFRAGDPPIWNRNETILPMSWRLFKNTIIQPGKDYSLQTIPTLSTAMDFDVRKNQPNFSKMLEKRMKQAEIAAKAAKQYQEAYGYSDYQIEQLDPDNFADEIMDIVCSTLNPEEAKAAVAAEAAGKKGDVPDSEEYEEMFDYIFGNQDTKGNDKFTDVKLGAYDEFSTVTKSQEQEAATYQAMQQQAEGEVMRYAGKTVSRSMLVSPMGVSHALDLALIRVYLGMKDEMDHDGYFVYRNGNLYGARDGQLYIKDRTTEFAADLKKVDEAAKAKGNRVYAEMALAEENGTSTVKRLEVGSYTITDAFLQFLATFPKAWPFCDGEFDRRMKSEMIGGETEAEFNARLQREQQGQGQLIAGSDEDDRRYMEQANWDAIDFRDRKAKIEEAKAKKAAKAAKKNRKSGTA